MSYYSKNEARALARQLHAETGDGYNIVCHTFGMYTLVRVPKVKQCYTAVAVVWITVVLSIAFLFHKAGAL